jgi:hypothetical protein
MKAEIGFQMFIQGYTEEGYEINVLSKEDAGIWDQIVAIVLGMAEPVDL